ncbi:hypothetical protein J3F84DRAFT_401296 [Trichoderma pleuroticola]
MASKGKTKATVWPPMPLSLDDLGLAPTDPNCEHAAACVRMYRAQAVRLTRAEQEEMLEYILQHDYVVRPSAVAVFSHKLYRATMKEVEKEGEDVSNVSWPIFLILSAIYGRLPKRYIQLVSSLHGTTEISDNTATYLATVRDPNDTSHASETGFNGSTSSSTSSTSTVPERSIGQARRSMATEAIADQTMSGPSPRDDDEHNTIIMQSSGEESPDKGKVQGGKGLGKRSASAATHEADAYPAAKRHRKASRHKPSNMAEVVDDVESSLLGQNDESAAGGCNHTAEIRREIKKQVKKQVKKEVQKILRVLTKSNARSSQDSMESASRDEYAPSGSDESEDDA